tara:strand:+ start:892 stop:1578 length:687 start_codon:yes stop_codon:yes gene_type:complete
MYEQLISNGFCDVRVVGFGSKWTGLMDKFRGIRNAMDADGLPDDDIFVFLDGFDSRIQMSPRVAVTRYVQHFPNNPALISKNNLWPFINNHIFLGSANSGMYMGPVHKVRKMLDACLLMKEEDNDQRCLNRVMNEGTAGVEIVIDHHKRVFRNLTHFERGPKCMPRNAVDAVFVSCPGEHSVSRWMRAVHEYFPYIKGQVMTVGLLVVLVIWLTRKRPNTESPKRPHD